MGERHIRRLAHAVRLALVAATLAAAACGRRDAAKRSDTAALSSASPSPSPHAGCANAGRWDACSVRERLDRAGLAPILRDSVVRSPLFSVAGTSFTLGRARLDVYLYPTPAALTRDLALIDTARVQRRDSTSKIEWPSPPTLIVNGNLVAVLLATSDRQVERVSDALTAGAPHDER